MSSILFKISDQLELEVKALMYTEGYTSKAEFFRFLVKYFKYNRNKNGNRTALERSSDELAETIMKLEREGKLDNLPSIEEQLADV